LILFNAIKTHTQSLTKVIIKKIYIKNNFSYFLGDFKKMKKNKIISLSIFTLILFLFQIFIVFAHPHPTVFIKANNETLLINALHWQNNINLDYLNSNLVLQDCNITDYYQNNQLKEYEIYIIANHSCGNNIVLLNNTLFEDFWGVYPMMVNIEGIETKQESNTQVIEGKYGTIYLMGYDKNEDNNNQNTNDNSNNIIKEINIGKFSIKNTPYILIPTLILLGIFFSITGEAINFIIPISLASKKNKDNKLWLKSGILHIISTYLFFFLTKNLIVSIISKYSFIILIIVGLFMYLDKKLNKIRIPSQIIALIPCPGAIFVTGYLLNTNIIIAYLTPLLMGIGELITLKIGNYIPIPKKIIRHIPIIIILCGIYLGFKSLI
jgi:hypothetical protein